MHVFFHVSLCHLHHTVILTLKNSEIKRHLCLTVVKEIFNVYERLNIVSIVLFDLKWHTRDQLSKWSYTNIEYWKSALFKFVTISQTGIFNAVRITNSIKCVWYWLSTGIQWKLLWYCSLRNFYRGISVLYIFTKSLWVAYIWKLHQFHINSRVYYCNSNLGFKIFDSHVRDLYGRGQPQGTCVLLEVLSPDS